MRRNVLAGLAAGARCAPPPCSGLHRRARGRGDPRARGLVREAPRRLRGDCRGRLSAPLGCLGVGGTASRCSRDRLRARAVDPRGRVDARDGRASPRQARARAGNALAGHDHAPHLPGGVVQRPLRRLGRARPLPVLRRPTASDRIGRGAGDRAAQAGRPRRGAGRDPVRRHGCATPLHDLSRRLGRLAGKRPQRVARRAVRRARHGHLRRLARSVSRTRARPGRAARAPPAGRDPHARRPHGLFDAHAPERGRPHRRRAPA